MKSVPGHPGIPAVVLYREEVIRDSPRLEQHYSRIKILTEEGRKFANVEIRTVGQWRSMVDEVSGRTIHSDGTMIPFTGKPHMKVIAHQGHSNYTWQQTEFTLPDVEVGSIIEYTYTTHHYLLAPTWEIQSDLYIKLAHFEWRPGTGMRYANGDAVGAISWYPVLPAGVQVEHTKVGYQGVFVSAKDVGYDTYAVNVKDIPPLPQERFMPPLSSVRYGVRFSYVSSGNEKFWTSEGAKWSKEIDKFIAPNNDVKKATEQIVAGAATQEDKARRIYGAVMEMENTAYTRQREASEDTAEGYKEMRTIADVLERKRGTANGLTSLFIGMARAAGLQAYAMAVPDRDQQIFTPEWLSIAQLSDEIAIVVIDGKERFFDPGSRYCSFGHLAWQHTMVRGMRQGPNGAVIDHTPGENAQTNFTARVANLNLDTHGEVTGKIDLTYSGSPALHWRQVALGTDEADLRTQLKAALVESLPGTIEVEVDDLKNLTDYEKPLSVSLTVKGSLGTTTGKRRLIPVDLFVARDTLAFPEEKRDLPVYFLYPESVQDALRINFPPEMALEAAPPSTTLQMPNRGGYDLSVISSTPRSFTTRRHYAFASVIVPVTDYSELRKFQSELEDKDHGTVVLSTPAATTSVVYQERYPEDRS